MTHLDRRILSAWTATANMHGPNPGATPDTVTAAEHTIGRRLPQAFHELYRVHDGGHWLNNDLILMPLDDGSELSVINAAETHRQWGWTVSDEVVVFGNDGGGDPFGLWLPAAETQPLVVHIGAIFEPGCMGIVGQYLSAFLQARTAYYLLPSDDTTTAGLDALDVPESLRVDRDRDLTDDIFLRILKWASPTVPSSLISPYEARLTANDLHQITTTA